MKRILLLVVLFLPAVIVNSQTVLDGIYIKEQTPERKVIPYTPLREADVLWSSRVWRIIDLREKLNHPLYYPLTPTNGRISFFDFIIKGIKEGPLLTFNSLYDDFSISLTRAEALAQLEDVRTAQIENIDNPGEYFEKVDTNRVEARQVIEYELKEDWFFDRQRSVMDVRIIGIAPIIRVIDPSNGEERGKKKLFWLYYPNCREVFANAESFNRFNDAERRTYEDIFWKRMFSSYVTKQSNVFDRSIEEYLTAGLDRLLEADKIKQEIMTLEMDMWHY
jgi:gliding motility associated protien GldN